MKKLLTIVFVFAVGVAAIAEPVEIEGISKVFWGTHYTHQMSLNQGKTWSLMNPDDPSGANDPKFLFVSKNAVTWIQGGTSFPVPKVWMAYGDDTGLINYFLPANLDPKIAMMEFRSWTEDSSYAMLIVYHWGKNKQVVEAMRSLHRVVK